MFGFQGGESADTVARKKGLQDAQQKWRFLTNCDSDQLRLLNDQDRGAALQNGHNALRDFAGAGKTGR
jgi:hypothetical protein